MPLRLSKRARRGAHRLTESGDAITGYFTDMHFARGMRVVAAAAAAAASPTYISQGAAASHARSWLGYFALAAFRGSSLGSITRPPRE